MNDKSKIEQFFVLLIICIGIFGIFVASGCGGGKSCETIKCSSQKNDGENTAGISVPGCGGCLSSGKGCDCSLWAQSCKYSCGEWEAEYTDAQGNTISNNVSIKGCDIRYYGDGCLGCGQKEKSKYWGCINGNEGEHEVNGFFYGSSDSEEKLIGCADGCGGCVADGNIGAQSLYGLEAWEGID